MIFRLPITSAFDYFFVPVANNNSCWVDFPVKVATLEINRPYIHHISIAHYIPCFYHVSTWRFIFWVDGMLPVNAFEDVFYRRTYITRCKIMWRPDRRARNQ